MTLPEAHVGDVGTVLQKTVTGSDGTTPLDLSTATAMVLIVTDAAENRTSLTGAFPAGGDGTDGVVEFTSESNTWTRAGTSREQVQVTFPSGTWSAEITEREIYRKL